MRLAHRTANNNYFSIKVEIFATKFFTLTLTPSHPITSGGKKYDIAPVNSEI